MSYKAEGLNLTTHFFLNVLLKKKQQMEQI